MSAARVLWTQKMLYGSGSRRGRKQTVRARFEPQQTPTLQTEDVNARAPSTSKQKQYMQRDGTRTRRGRRYGRGRSLIVCEGGKCEIGLRLVCFKRSGCLRTHTRPHPYAERKLRPDLLFQASTFAHHSTKRPSPARPHVFARAAFSVPHREIVSAIPVCCGGWECRRSSRASRQIATGQGAACTANTARVPQARPTLAPLSNIARFDVPRCRACSLSIAFAISLCPWTWNI